MPDGLARVEPLRFDPVRFRSEDEQERWFATLAKTIAVDFDGVLHPYTKGWTGSTPDDEEPMPGAHTFLKMLVDQGYLVVVFSTRCDHEEGLAGTTAWLDKHGLLQFIVKVTHEKPAAVAYVDDRAVRFRRTQSTSDGWCAVLDDIRELASGAPHGAARQETIDEKLRVEAMVTAVLTSDPQGQAVAAEGLSASEERYVRAGAGIIAGLFAALGQRSGVAASKLWREHMKHTSASRGR